MQIEKYTDRLKSLIEAAQSLALRNGHQQLTPLHVLKALLDDPDRLAANLIEAAGGTVTPVLQTLERELAKLPRIEGGGAGQVCCALRASSSPNVALKRHPSRPWPQPPIRNPTRPIIPTDLRSVRLRAGTRATSRRTLWLP